MQEQSALCNAVSATGSIILSDKELRITGDYLTFINGYLKKAYGDKFIPISDVLSIRYYKIRSKRSLMAFLYSGGLAILFKQVCDKLSKSNFTESLMQSISTYTTMIYYLGLAFSSIMLLLYAIKRYSLLDISYLGGRICFHVNIFNKSQLDKLISCFYSLKR